MDILKSTLGGGNKNDLLSALMVIIGG